MFLGAVAWSTVWVQTLQVLKFFMASLNLHAFPQPIDITPRVLSISAIPPSPAPFGAHAHSWWKQTDSDVSGDFAIEERLREAELKERVKMLKDSMGS